MVGKRSFGMFFYTMYLASYVAVLFFVRPNRWGLEGVPPCLSRYIFYDVKVSC